MEYDESKHSRVIALHDRMRAIEKERAELQKEWEWLNREMLSLLGDLIGKNIGHD